jgi:hypothetical protein
MLYNRGELTLTSLNVRYMRNSLITNVRQSFTKLVSLTILLAAVLAQGLNPQLTSYHNLVLAHNHNLISSFKDKLLLISRECPLTHVVIPVHSRRHLHLAERDGMRLLQCNNVGEFSLTRDLIDNDTIPP